LVWVTRSLASISLPSRRPTRAADRDHDDHPTSGPLCTLGHGLNLLDGAAMRRLRDSFDISARCASSTHVPTR
ncbi:MAG TPA: hypothetical protein VII33_18300, partial [Nakamurella sp.]